MATSKIKKGDHVRVIAGKDKNKEGKIIAVNKKDGTVLVEGVNMISKHMKQQQSKTGTTGGIVEKEGPVDISNVMYMYKGTPTRVGFVEKDGKKVRVAKSTGDVID